MYGKNIAIVVNEVGRKVPVFGDAANIAQAILNTGLEFNKGKLLFNTFRTVVSFRTTEMPLYSQSAVANAAKLPVYDSLDADVIQSYMEYSLASLIYYAMKENATSEQSSRMSAMDSASKNAGNLTFYKILFWIKCLRVCWHFFRWNDQQVDVDFQPHSSSRHYPWTDRNYFRRFCLVKSQYN